MKKNNPQIYFLKVDVKWKFCFWWSFEFSNGRQLELIVYVSCVIHVGDFTKLINESLYFRMFWCSLFLLLFKGIDSDFWVSFNMVSRNEYDHRVFVIV